MSQPPKLPTHVSANGAEIWGWGMALSQWSQRQHKMRLLRQDIAKVDCGGCSQWMTRACPRERNVNGRNHGPSMYDQPCASYTEKPSTTTLRDDRRAELAALVAEDAGQ